VEILKRKRRKVSILEYSIYNVSDDDMLWKLIRIEVFKCPNHRNLICAAVGGGFQLVLMVSPIPVKFKHQVLILFILGVLGMYYQHKGSILTASVLLYSLTAGE
jgi:hypothetical protein